MNSLHRLAATAIVGLMTTQGTAWASGNSGINPDPVGTWLLDVTFLSGNPPTFKEMITLHANGTVTETNTTLNGASGFLPQPVFNLVGSDGQGAWRRLPGGRIGLSVTKLVFCGPAPSLIPLPPPAPPLEICGGSSGALPGTHIGYLRVTWQATVSGGQLKVAPSDSRTELILDPENPRGPGIDFGPASASGKRLH